MERGNHSAGVFSEAIQAKMDAIADRFLPKRATGAYAGTVCLAREAERLMLVKCDHEYLPWADDHP